MTVAAAVAAGLIVVVALGLLAERRRSGPAPALAPPSATVATDPLSRMVDALRRRRWARRTLSFVSVVLLAVAVGMLGYPFYTNLYQSRLQSRLDRELASEEIKEAYAAGQIETGDSLTRLEIPALDVDVVVVEGITSSALRAGAGHYPDTPLPCEQGNVAIAGHRTTYGRPFHNVDRLKPGDDIILSTPIGRCTYKVEKPPFIVAPTDLSVVGPTPTGALTLTTCHPKGSAAKRLIVRAVLAPGESSGA